jgi:exodeoxyribonuclease VII large subunit
MSGHGQQLFDPEAPPGPAAAAREAPAVPAGAVEPEESGGPAGVLSIGALYDEVEGALASVFPRGRQLWVRGEIQSVSDQSGRSGHCYLDLVDPGEGERGPAARGRGGPVLKVKCWSRTWGPMRGALVKEGIELTEGMVVVLRGAINLYRPKGEIDFTLSELDVTALLGRLAAQRAALLRKLEAEGLLRRNAGVPVPDVALRVGLVASPGTEGYRDFLSQLTGSPFGFSVQVVPVKVQGRDAPGAVALAIRKLCRTDCDVLVVVRGGGSKADLTAFDTEVVARAIATATKPVWTGIGHTGDESLADIVAGRSYITPTECGHELVVRVGQWWEAKVGLPAAALARRVPALLADSQRRDTAARGQLTMATRNHLRLHRERLGRRAGGVVRQAPLGLAARQTGLRSVASRLGPRAQGHLSSEVERVRAWRRLLTAYDVDRQLERGYTLTVGADGRLLRSARGVAVGDEVVTRFADGTTRARVLGSEVREDRRAEKEEEQ